MRRDGQRLLQRKGRHAENYDVFRRRGTAIVVSRRPGLGERGSPRFFRAHGVLHDRADALSQTRLARWVGVNKSKSFTIVRFISKRVKRFNMSKLSTELC